MVSYWTCETKWLGCVTRVVIYLTVICNSGSVELVYYIVQCETVLLQCIYMLYTCLVLCGTIAL